MSRMASYLNLNMWIYIVTVAIIAGCIGALEDYVGGAILTGKFRMPWSKWAQSINPFYGWAMFTGTMMIQALIATTICGWIAPTAQGSGVPPLKVVLSGVPIYKFLDWKILLAKSTALFFSLGSGIGTGKEGPMIHISSMVSYNLGRLPYYRNIVANPFYKRTLLNAAVACGVTSTFGTPYGAICFSIELCSTVFLLSNLWKLFVTASVVKIVFDFWAFNGYVATIQSDFVYVGNHNVSYYLHYIVIGLICGWIGSLWVMCFSIFLQYKAQSPIKFLKNRYFYVVMMSLVLGTIQYPFTTSWAGNKGLLNWFWKLDHLDDGSAPTFQKGYVELELAGTFLMRWLMIMCFATMPLPSGVSLPSITQGAILGRLYGEILRWYDPDVQVQSFSIVGAAAYAGVLTRTTSVTLVIMELTGQTKLILGIMLGNLCSYAVANIFTMSAFNTAMTVGKMPYLPFMFTSALYKRVAGDFMDEATECMNEDSTLMDIIEFFANKAQFDNDEFIPIVEDQEDKKIVGSVRTWDILNYIQKVCEAIEVETKEGKTSELIEKFTRKLTQLVDSDSADAHQHTKNANELFMKMPERMRLFIKELQGNETKLDFGAGGISAIGGASLETALKDKWCQAIETYYVRKGEKDAGEGESKIKVFDEYYLFIKLIFSKMKVDWQNHLVKWNSHPILVDRNTKIIKLHFLFQMLGIQSILIAERGKYKGRLTLMKFLNLRYTEQVLL